MSKLFTRPVNFSNEFEAASSTDESAALSSRGGLAVRKSIFSGRKVTAEGGFDATGQRVLNVGDAVDATDAVNLSSLQTNVDGSSIETDAEGRFRIAAGAIGGGLVGGSGTPISVPIDNATIVQQGGIVKVNPDVTLNSVTANGLSVFKAGLSAGNRPITNVGNPLQATDAVNRATLDAFRVNLTVKESAVVATIGPGNLATDFCAGMTIDGIVLQAGWIILIKDQTNAIENGIYVVPATSVLPSRADTLALGAHAAGAFCFVQTGTVNRSAGFTVNNSAQSGDIVGTHALNFIQFSGAGDIIAGAAMTKSGNQLDVAVNSDTLEIVADQLNVKSSLPTITSVGTLVSLAVAGNVTAATPPTLSSHLANKAYIDGLSYLLAGTGLSLNTGTLSVNSSQPSIVSLGTLTTLAVSGNVSSAPAPTVSAHLTNKAYVDGLSYVTVGSGISKTGATLALNASQTFGDITVLNNVSNAVAPTTSAHLTNKAYVDALSYLSVGSGLALSGGQITLSNNQFFASVSASLAPSLANHLTNKTYVDGLSYLTAGTGLTKTGATLSVNAAQPGITSVGTLTSLGVTGAITSSSLSATSASFTGSLSAGPTTVAALTGTSATFSSTLGVTGASTLGALTATSGSVSGTFAVTGATTLGALNATTATISGALSGTSATLSGTFGVTGGTTLGTLTINGGIQPLNSGGMVLANDVHNNFKFAAGAGALASWNVNTSAGVNIMSLTNNGTASFGPLNAATITSSGSLTAGATTLGALSATSSTLSGNLAVTGTTTLGALTAASATISGIGFAALKTNVDTNTSDIVSLKNASFTTATSAGQLYPPTGVKFTTSPQTITGAPYGNGPWSFSATSSFNTTSNAAFNILQAEGSNVLPVSWWASAAGLYTASTGAYTGAASTTVSGTAYLGERVNVLFPSPRTLTTVTIHPVSNQSPGCPTRFIIAGINADGTYTAQFVQTTAIATFVQYTPQTFTMTTPAVFAGFAIIVLQTGPNNPGGTLTNFVVTFTATTQLLDAETIDVNNLNANGIPLGAQMTTAALKVLDRVDYDATTRLVLPIPGAPFTAADQTISGQQYGNGRYTWFGNSNGGAGREVYRLFSSSPTDGWATATGRYNATTGSYTSTASITISGTGTQYAGDTAGLSLMPTPRVFSRFFIRPLVAADGTDLSLQAPATFIVFGDTPAGARVALFVQTTAVTYQKGVPLVIDATATPLVTTVYISVQTIGANSGQTQAFFNMTAVYTQPNLRLPAVDAASLAINGIQFNPLNIAATSATLSGTLAVTGTTTLGTLNGTTATISGASRFGSTFATPGTGIPLVVNSGAGNGGTGSLAPPVSVLVLGRDGVSTQTYSNMVAFNVSRYALTGSLPKTQLDIVVSDASFADTPDKTLMSLLATGINIPLTTSSALSVAGGVTIGTTLAVTGAATFAGGIQPVNAGGTIMAFDQFNNFKFAPGANASSSWGVFTNTGAAIMTLGNTGGANFSGPLAVTGATNLGTVNATTATMSGFVRATGTTATVSEALLGSSRVDIGINGSPRILFEQSAATVGKIWEMDVDTAGVFRLYVPATSPGTGNFLNISPTTGNVAIAGAVTIAGGIQPINPNGMIMAFDVSNNFKFAPTSSVASWNVYTNTGATIMSLANHTGGAIFPGPVSITGTLSSPTINAAGTTSLFNEDMMLTSANGATLAGGMQYVSGTTPPNYSYFQTGTTTPQNGSISYQANPGTGFTVDFDYTQSSGEGMSFSFYQSSVPADCYTNNGGYLVVFSQFLNSIAIVPPGIASARVGTTTTLTSGVTGSASSFTSLIPSTFTPVSITYKNGFLAVYVNGALVNSVKTTTPAVASVQGTYCAFTATTPTNGYQYVRNMRLRKSIGFTNAQGSGNLVYNNGSVSIGGALSAGATTLASLVASSATITTSINAGLNSITTNTSNGTSAFALLGAYNDTAFGLNAFCNSSTRTADGGANNATIRNDVGDLLLQAKAGGSGGLGLRIAATTNNATMTGTLNVTGGVWIGNMTGVNGSVTAATSAGQLYPPTGVRFTSSPQTITGAPYGNGPWTFSATSQIPGASTAPYNILNYEGSGIAGFTQWASVGGTYNTSAGAYLGSASTTVSGTAYLGERVNVLFPTPRTMTTLTIHPILNQAAGCPTRFVVAGINADGTYTAQFLQTTAIPQFTAYSPQTFTMSTPAVFSGFAIIVLQVGIGNPAGTCCNFTTAFTATTAVLDAETVDINNLNVNGVPIGTALTTASLKVLDGITYDPTIKLGLPIPGVTFTSNTHEVSGQQYGNGVYTFSASSFFNAGREPFRVITSAGNTWSSAARYNTSTGAYTGSFTTTTANGTVYSGEQVGLAFPAPITLSRIFMRSSPVNNVLLAPATFVIVGDTPAGTRQLIYQQTTALTYPGQGVPVPIDISGTYKSLYVVVQTIGANSTADICLFSFALNYTQPNLRLPAVDASSLAIAGVPFNPLNIAATSATISGTVSIGSTAAGPNLTVSGRGIVATLVNSSSSPSQTSLTLQNTINGTSGYLGLDGSGLQNLIQDALTLFVNNGKPIQLLTSATIQMNAPIVMTNTASFAPPSFTTRSIGTKLVLYGGGPTATAVEYALGIEGGTLWSSVPDTVSFFRWYGGTTLAATLTGAGALTTIGPLTVPSATINGSMNVTGATTLGALSATSANISQLNSPTLNVAGTTSLFLEDMLLTSNNGAILAGGAQYITGTTAPDFSYFRVSGGAAAQSGSVSYQGNPGTAFTLDFDYHYIVGNDGMSFAFYQSSVPADCYVNNGGYLVVFSQFLNSIAIVPPAVASARVGTTTTLTSGVTGSASTFSSLIAATTWTPISITYKNGYLAVYVNGVLVNSVKTTTPAVASVQGTFCAFSAFTPANNYHSVRNMRLRKEIGFNNVQGSGNLVYNNGSVLIGAATDGSILNGTGALQITGGASVAKWLTVGGGGLANGTSVVGGLSFEYVSGGGFRHWVRSRHDAGGATSGNAIDFFLNTGTTAAASSAVGTGNVLGMSVSATGVTAAGLTVNTTGEVIPVKNGNCYLLAQAIPGSRVRLAAYDGGIANYRPLSIESSLVVTDTSESNATNTGALQVAGGVGIAKSLFVGTGLGVGAATGPLPTSFLNPALMQLKGTNTLDSSTHLLITNGANDYGRSALILTGRLQDGNDTWALTQPRNGILFNRNSAASGASVGALGTTEFALQYNMLSNQFGILASGFSTTLPAVSVSSNGALTAGATTLGALTGTSASFSSPVTVITPFDAFFIGNTTTAVRGGITTQQDQGGLLLNLSCNTGYGGGAPNTSFNGGCLRIDSRTASPLFQFFNRADASLMTLDNGGNLRVAGQFYATGGHQPLNGGGMILGNDQFNNFKFGSSAGASATWNVNGSTGNLIMSLTNSGGVGFGSAISASSLAINGGKSFFGGGLNATNTDGNLNVQDLAGIFASFYVSATKVGSITANGSTAVSYNTTSDYRLKENLIDLENASSRLQQLPVHRFNFIGNSQTVDGFVAHEVATVVPEAVTGEKDAVDDDGKMVAQMVDHSKLVPLLAAALKEALQRIEKLESLLVNQG